MEKIKVKKVLILANTYFQIIIAIKLKNTIYKNDIVDIIISDHSSTAKNIYLNIVENNIFNKVFYYESKEEKERNKFLKIIDDINFLIFPKYNCKKRNLLFCDYDEFIFYNINKYTVLIYDTIYYLNKNVKLIRYEEGYISYLHSNIGLSKYYCFLRKLLRKQDFVNCIKKNYLFHPDLLIYNPVGDVEQIENINRDDVKTISEINKTFNYNKLNDIYNRKYIFFEESFFCDKKGIEDMDLILKLSEIVGKENILVKLHPRNTVDRFSKYGILTNKTEGIPWEVIQMNNNFDGKVLLTISSGSVLASKLYFNDNIKTYVLYNCTKKMSDMVTNEYLEYLNKLKEKSNLNNFIIPKNYEEFLKDLKKEVENE